MMLPETGKHHQTSYDLHSRRLQGSNSQERNRQAKALRTGGYGERI